MIKAKRNGVTELREQVFFSLFFMHIDVLDDCASEKIINSIVFSFYLQ
jgi:hypothetical protein